jgi:hypothetical protein
MPPLRETDLYPPVKDFLERQGYDVKSEVSNCDVVAVRGDEEPVVVELKTAFTLPLVFQALERQSMTDLVYVAFAVQRGGPKAGVWGRRYRDILKLCRMLGLGLITLRMDGTEPRGLEVHLDPAPYRPRKNKRRRGVLLREFERRIGDPNQGGMSKRPVVTAYRQDALRCAWFLRSRGPSKAGLLRTELGVDRAPRILQRDVYGWFQRVERGIYAITPAGERGLHTYADIVEALTKTRPEGPKSSS